MASRAIARRLDFTGTVLGIDLGPFLVETAIRLAGEEGFADKVSFRVGDKSILDIVDSRFDAVVAHTLVSLTSVTPSP